MNDFFDLTEPVFPSVDLSFLEELNPEQREAVEMTEGPLLVLSGAGTGKTRVLTTRIAYLLVQKMANPWQILAVTFTNKASREMKDRLEQMIGLPARSVWLGTFHSIGIRILSRYTAEIGLKPNFIVPTRSIGTLIRAITVPVGSRSKNLVIIIAIPETPPEATLLGSRKHATPAANIIDPSVSVKRSVRVLFSFFLSIFIIFMSPKNIL